MPPRLICSHTPHCSWTPLQDFFISSTKPKSLRSGTFPSFPPRLQPWSGPSQPVIDHLYSISPFNAFIDSSYPLNISQCIPVLTLSSPSSPDWSHLSLLLSGTQCLVLVRRGQASTLVTKGPIQVALHIRVCFLFTKICTALYNIVPSDLSSLDLVKAPSQHKLCLPERLGSSRGLTPAYQCFIWKWHLDL